MTISTASKLLNMYLEFNPHRHDLGTAINVVLQELDKSYNKGYQDGFKQAKYEVEMDKIKEENNDQV